MRIVLLIILLFVIFSILWKSRGSFSGKFILMFAGVWFLDLFLVAVDASQVGGVRFAVFGLVLASVLAFIIAFRLVRKQEVDAEYSHSCIDKRIDALFSFKIINLAYIILLGYIVMNLMFALPILLAAGNLGGGLRVDALTGNLYSPLFYLVNVYVLAPVYNITLPLMAYLFINGKHKFSFVITLLYCILYPSLFGSRMSFIVMGFIIILCYLWVKNCKGNYIRKGFNKFVTIMVSGIVALFTIMSILKSGDITNAEQSFQDLKDDLITQPVEYFSCPVKAFEYAFDHNYHQRMGGYMHGRATLAALDYYVNPILNSLSGLRNPNANSVIGHIIQDEWISFSLEVDSWNALYTALLHFYLDFGWIGCLLFSFLFGLIASKTCNSLERSGSVPVFVFSFFVMIKCIMSVISFFPVGGDVLPFIVYVVVWRTLEKMQMRRC